MDFHQLLAMNAGIIGANMSHLQLLSDLFEQLLAPHVNAQPGEAEIAADLLALRFFREAQGELQLKDDPSTRRRYVKHVQRFVSGLTREQRLKLGTKSFDRLFHDQPEISNYFKTSNMRLAFIVGKALDFSARLFDEPALMVDEMTQLGLKHIMFQAQSQFFQPWVSALMAEIQQITADEEVVQGMNYALCVIGSIIAQAVETGSTPVLQAIVNDDVKALKSALRATPRAERAEAVLGRA
eukprot:g23000.t1